MYVDVPQYKEKKVPKVVEKFVEVPVEKIVYQDRVVEVPYEKVVYQDKVNVEEVEVEKIVERVVKVEVDGPEIPPSSDGPPPPELQDLRTQISQLKLKVERARKEAAAAAVKKSREHTAYYLAYLVCHGIQCM